MNPCMNEECECRRIEEGDIVDVRGAKGAGEIVYRSVKVLEVFHDDSGDARLIIEAIARIAVKADRATVTQSPP